MRMGKGSFQKLDKPEERMYGARKLLVCGYKADEHETYLDFLKRIGFEELPVVFVVDEQQEMTLSDIIEEPHGSGTGKDSGLKRAAILCGFTQEEIHRILSAHRSASMPPQLWATLTPVSEKWTISQLLNELQKEANEIKKRQGRSK